MTRKTLIIQAAKKAGQEIASIKPSHTTVIDKEGRGNYVTLADKHSEAIIFSLIRENFPHDTVLSEETPIELSQSELLRSEHLWIIDPIDGTANYQHQRKYSSISLGYAEGGQLKLGVVYDPFREELFFGEHGKGAFRNGEKINVSQKRNLHHCTIITDNSYNPATIRQHLEALLKIPQTPWILMKGSSALELCEVAAGQADLFFSYCLKPWDNAAGFLMIEEAGGVIVDKKGQKVNFFSKIVIAGNPIITQEFVKITK